MKIIKIKGQRIFDSDRNYHLHINELWWGAWKKFGWEKGRAGIGIAKATLDKAEAEGRKLKISFYNNWKREYLISPKNFKKIALETGGEYLARNRTKLLVIPADRLEKIPSKPDRTKKELVRADREMYVKQLFLI